MKDRTIKKSQIPNEQNIEIYPCHNGFKLVAGCKEFICTHAQFIPLMVHYGNGEYEKALKLLGVDVVEEVYTDYMNSGSGLRTLNAVNKLRVDDEAAEKYGIPKIKQIRGKRRSRPRKAKV